MGDPVLGLRDDLIRMQHLLGRGTFLTFSSDEKQVLLTNSQRLLQKLDSLAEGFLTVGLIGGTGVGKSTLMNALAGAEISSTSHRRPHTHQVLIYHHKATELPPSIRGTEVPWVDYTHEVDRVRQILLCDMPDFDSLAGENREHVLRFLEHLDILVWVTSLEKYADRKFYEFLNLVPKARQNFYFVLNKLDLLFQERPLDVGYEELGRVTSKLQDHLREADIADPILYNISSREALQSSSLSPWNQFAAFRQQVFQQRDIKEITAIKAANLDVEAQHILSSLQKEVINLEVLRDVLEGLVGEFEAGRAEWVDAGRKGIDSWLLRNLKDEVLTEMTDLNPLVGPGRLLAMVGKEWQVVARNRGGDPSMPALFSPPEQTSISLQRQLERLEHRAVHQFHRVGLPPSFVEKLESFLDIRREWEGLVERWRDTLEVRLAVDAKPPLKRFVGSQFLAYGVLYFLFLFALAGEPAWRRLVETPGWESLVFLFLAAVYTLFSPVGLAALATYLVLNALLAIRFYRRYKKLLQHRAQRFVESVKADMEHAWEGVLDHIVVQLRKYAEEVRLQIADIAALAGSAHGR